MDKNDRRDNRPLPTQPWAIIVDPFTARSYKIVSAFRAFVNSEPYNFDQEGVIERVKEEAKKLQAPKILFLIIRSTSFYEEDDWRDYFFRIKEELEAAKLRHLKAVILVIIGKLERNLETNSYSPEEKGAKAYGLPFIVYDIDDHDYGAEAVERLTELFFATCNTPHYRPGDEIKIAWYINRAYYRIVDRTKPLGLKPFVKIKDFYDQRGRLIIRTPRE